MISSMWGQPEVDLFASKENAQVPRFFSLNNLDGSLGTDALARPWRFHLCYAFLPFQLIPLVLKKIQQEGVPVILITPFWPKRAWFSTILGMATRFCWHLPLRQEVARLSFAAWYSLEQLLKNKGFLDCLVTTLLSSRKKVTRAIYTKVWKVYTWCISSSQDPKKLMSILESF